MSDSEYKEFDDVSPPWENVRRRGWMKQVKELSSAALVSIREAVADGPDGQRMSDVQNVTERLPILDVKKNVLKIAKTVVLLAEIDGVHVGFCISLPGHQDSDPLIIQEVGVVPGARGRGIGMMLLRAAAEREPRRNIALATEDDNEGAQALNKKFATSIGATMRKVNLGTYEDSDLGIQRGLGYRSWVIERQGVAADVGKELT